MQGMHNVPAQLRWKEGAEQTPALLLKERPGNPRVENAPELRRQEPWLWDHLPASYKDQAPAFPSHHILKPAAGGRRQILH